MRLGRWGWADRYLSGRLRAWRDSILAVRRLYKSVNDRRLKLIRPRRFCDKMQWRKLFDLNPAYAVFSDKYATRRYVAERIGGHVLPKLLWAGTDPGEIPFDRMTPPYVLKSTHAYGHVAIVEAGTTPDREQLRSDARSWLAYNHGSHMDEPGYRNVTPGLIVEELLVDDAGQPPQERKVFVFGGKARVMETIVIVPGSRDRLTAFHTTDWTRLPWRSFREPFGGELAKPPLLAEFVAAAEELARGFDHLRVDIYDCGSSFRVGEITVYSWSGLTTFQPDSVDHTLGDWWPLRFPLTRAVFAVLFRRREIHPPAPSPAMEPGIEQAETA